MSRYSSLTGFLIIFALFGNIVAPDDDTGGKGSSSRARSAGKKILGGLSAYWSRLVLSSRYVPLWRDVLISPQGGDEKGLLRASYHRILQPYFDFYPNSTLVNGRSRGVVPKFCFAEETMVKKERKGNVVVIILPSGECTLTFKNEDNAITFFR